MSESFGNLGEGSRQKTLRQELNSLFRKQQKKLFCLELIRGAGEEWKMKSEKWWSTTSLKPHLGFHSERGELLEGFEQRSDEVWLFGCCVKDILMVTTQTRMIAVGRWKVVRFWICFEGRAVNGWMKSLKSGVIVSLHVWPWAWCSLMRGWEVLIWDQTSC